MNRRPSPFGISLLFAALVLAGCAAEADGTPAVDRSKPGPLMRSGENCLSCHRTGGQAGNKVWSAAGTVFTSATSAQDEGVEGATITIEDANGKTVNLESNAVGNFYTAEPLVKPLQMRIAYQGKSAAMPIPLNADGACNACHSHPDPIGGAAGRIRIPR